MKRVFIIAEAGVNHNGDIAIAKSMIDKAVDCGADAVKFQTFITENCISKVAKKAEYQINNTSEGDSQFSMIKKLELSFNDFRVLNDYCEQRGILFLSTPFDIESIAFLNEIDIPMWKIPSGEITNLPYLIRIANTHKPIIMSTGMGNIQEIKDAIRILKENGADTIKLLHCNTEYPTPYEDVNLYAMQTLRDVFQCDIGYSDHTQGIEVAIAAVAMGASIIEKHFTLNRNMEGPDHKSSLEPNELSTLVNCIRNIEKALGSHEKKASESEKKNIEIARKSIIAKKQILKGEIFTEDNITTKRPGNGISPMKWYDILGKTAIKDFKEDDLIVM